MVTIPGGRAVVILAGGRAVVIVPGVGRWS